MRCWSTFSRDLALTESPRWASIPCLNTLEPTRGTLCPLRGLFFIGEYGLRVDRYPNVSGWAGTDRTIKAMEDMVLKGRMDETVIFAASQVLRKVDPKDYFGQVAALHEWVKANIHYVRDPNSVELLRSPDWTLYYRTGDCDDQAVLLSSLAQAVGFQTHFKAIKGDSSHPKEFSHVYSQVLIPEKGWVTSDTIVPHAKFGWESEERFGSYTWGGLGMIGNLGDVISLDTGAAVAAAPVEKNFWGLFRDVVQTTVVGAIGAYGEELVANINTNVGSFVQTPASGAAKAVAKKSSGLSSAIVPLALIGGVGVLALSVMRKKRR